jgi:uncharacterized damage-inducible protein DinB
MYDTAGDLIGGLDAAPDALAGLLAGVEDDLARLARGGDEGWSIVEVVCHLRDCEERALERLRAMRDADEPELAAYDQDALAIERDYAGDDLGRAAAAFAAYRAKHVTALRALPAAARERSGRHEEVGRITILGQTIHIATHDVQHLGQIARALRDARATRPAAPG